MSLGFPFFVGPSSRPAPPNTPPAPRHYDAFPPDILPPQRAQFSAPHSCKHHQCKNSFGKGRRLLQQSEKTFGFFVCRDLLLLYFASGFPMHCAGLYAMIWFLFASFSTTETTPQYFCTVASPSCLPLGPGCFRSRSKRYSIVIGRSSFRRICPISPYTRLQHLPVPGERTGA